jgi:hypothetical protein
MPFCQHTDKPAGQLVMILPGIDALSFFLGLGRVFENGKPDRDTLSLLGKEWGVELLGLPLSPRKLS